MRRPQDESVVIRISCKCADWTECFVRNEEIVDDPANGTMNDLERYAGLFDTIPPHTTSAPPGYLVDFLGNLIRKDFLRGMSLMAGAQSRYAAGLAGPDPRLPVPLLGDGGN